MVLIIWIRRWDSLALYSYLEVQLEDVAQVDQLEEGKLKVVWDLKLKNRMKLDLWMDRVDELE